MSSQEGSGQEEESNKTNEEVRRKPEEEREKWKVRREGEDVSGKFGEIEAGFLLVWRF